MTPAEWGSAIQNATVFRMLVVVLLAVAVGSGLHWAGRQRASPLRGGVPDTPASPRPATVVEEAAAAAADPSEPIGERFIRTMLTNPDGTLRTTLSPLTRPDDDRAWGEEALSESLGLWMLYLYEKGDETSFADAVRVLREHFWRDGWIHWKVGPGGRRASTNALVDDLRIAEALYRAGFQWEVEPYLALADGIARSIKTYQIVGGLPADFYDYDHDWTAEELTLSYVNLAALEMMVDRGVMLAGVYERARTLLDTLPQQGGFFPFSYDLKRGRYRYHQDINLIDQLYIVYHRQQAGIPSPEFWNILKEAFRRDGVVYGKLAIDSGRPAVAYESPAVYGLAILAALEAGDADLAGDLYRRMTRLQVRNPGSRYYGGYVFDHDTHSFDNLVPLLAEWKLHGRVP